MRQINEPLVSVIIPTYKRNNLLERALQSVIKQTYKHIEIIVVDDNGVKLEYRNQVEEIIQKSKHSTQMPIILAQNEKNLGGGESRNVGIKLSKGEYITFLDDDDFYLPEKVEKQVKKLLKSGKDVSVSNMQVVKGNNKNRIIRQPYGLEFMSQEKLIKSHLMYHITGTPTIMLKSRVALKSGGFPNISSAQEFYFIYKLIDIGASFDYLDEELVCIDQNHGERISTGEHKLEGIDNLLEFKKKHKNLFSRREWNYILVRHQLVLSNYYLKNNSIYNFILNIIISFLKGPYSFIKILKKEI